MQSAKNSSAFDADTIKKLVYVILVCELANLVLAAVTFVRFH